jgi:hypothetical protein
MRCACTNFRAPSSLDMQRTIASTSRPRARNYPLTSKAVHVHTVMQLLLENLPVAALPTGTAKAACLDPREGFELLAPRRGIEPLP